VPVLLTVLAMGAVAVGVPTSARAASPAAGATPPVPVTAADIGPATNGLITCTCLNHNGTGQNGWVTANAGGSGKVFTAWTRGDFDGSAQWSADGTEMVHSAAFTPPPPAGQPRQTRVMLSEADGSYPWQLTTDDAAAGSADVAPAWSPSGQYLAFTRLGPRGAGVGYTVGAGLANPGAPVDNTDTADIAPNGDRVYLTNGTHLTYWPAGGTAVQLGVGLRPHFNRTGTLFAYVSAANNTLIYETNASGIAPLLIATAPSGPITDFAWSPDGKQLLIAAANQVWVQDVVTGAHQKEVGGPDCLGGSRQVSWQPVPTTPEQVVRMAGADRVGTALKVSQDSYGNNSAAAVVLADSMHFPDALAGTPLAVKEHGPLLLTNGSKGTVDPRLLPEIARVLGTGSKQVFVLGGTGSVSQGIEDQLKALHYTVTRLWGTDRYGTALAIARWIGTSPTSIFLATGTDFPDGLSAGAAAGFKGGVLLLTNGKTLPAAVASYLDDARSNNPGLVTVVAVGGLAHQADPTAEVSLVGSDRYATSELVAEKEFGPTPIVGLATGLSFPDALSGGAAAAFDGAPLLVASPTSRWLLTTGAVPSFLHAWSAAINQAFVFGGTAVVPQEAENDLAGIIGLKTTETTAVGPVHVLSAGGR
jgi:hypothetical protein